MGGGEDETKRAKGCRGNAPLNQQKTENRLWYTAVPRWLWPREKASFTSLCPFSLLKKKALRAAFGLQLKWTVKRHGRKEIVEREREREPQTGWCRPYGADTGWYSLYRALLLHICWKLKEMFFSPVTKSMLSIMPKPLTIYMCVYIYIYIYTIVYMINI